MNQLKIKYNEVQVLHRSSKHGKSRRQKMLGSTDKSALFENEVLCQRSLLELSPVDLYWSLVFNNSKNNSKELCWHSLQSSPHTPTFPTLVECTCPTRKAIWAKVLFYSFSKKYTFHPTLHRIQTMGAPLHRAWVSTLKNENLLLVS